MFAEKCSLHIDFPEKDLTPLDLKNFAQSDARFKSTEIQRDRVSQSFKRLIHQLESGSLYGSTTHFGHNVNTQNAASDWEAHQSGLLEFLNVGRGKTLPTRIVRRALRLQAFKLGLGFSGVHPQTFELLIDYSNSDSLHPVPCLGSLGASGDLISMSHAVHPLRAQGVPYGPRDALSLVNTNAMMCSLAFEIYDSAKNLLDSAYQTTAYSSLALQVPHNAFDPDRLTLGLTKNSALLISQSASRLQNHRTLSLREAMLLSKEIKKNPLQHFETPLQERYSLRCAPQILSAAEENLQNAELRILDESANLSDNPIISEFGPHHGGRFYTARLASACELMTDVIIRICEMLDRQVHLLVTPEFSHGLPANLMISDSADSVTLKHDHVKGIHQLISACLQQLKGLSLSSALMSSPAESYNQDVLPATMAKLNNLHFGLDLLTTISDAAQFISKRALCLRLGLQIPHDLRLAHWQTKGSIDDWTP